MSAPRDFTAELAEARKAEDWKTHARIWEERRLAAVDADEAEHLDRCAVGAWA
jgi:hypothetical protein